MNGACHTLAPRGVAIEEVEVEPKTPARPRGRPSAMRMDEASDDRLRALWKDAAVDGGYVVDLACDEAGMDKKDRKTRHRIRQRLQRRYGARSEA